MIERIPAPSGSVLAEAVVYSLTPLAFGAATALTALVGQAGCAALRVWRGSKGR